MKFEGKYLIRWGIPGWVFLLNIIWLFWRYNSNDYFSSFSKDPKNLLSFLVTITSIGVPVGYIFHQVYFGLFWALSKKKAVKGFDTISKYIKGYKAKYPNDVDKEYYYLEYLWQSELSLLEKSKRDYIAERYRYLLSTTHSLGVLFLSMSVSFIFFLFILKSIDISMLDKIMYSSIELLANGLILLNYFYYSRKTHAFQGMFLNEFINEPERNNERKIQNLENQ